MTPRTMRRVYLREAAIMLMLACLAVRFVSATRLFDWADRPMKKVNRFAIAEANWVAWAIETTAIRRGMDAQCLPRALAAHAMLRRRGIASKLCLGVARDGRDITAHAWIETGGRVLVGGEDQQRFAPLAAFGGTK
ncbi:MAG: lasso peptide biosynthesis B2 protein [Pseudorhodoplanes sp.]